MTGWPTEKVLLLKVTITKFGLERKGDITEITTAADKSRLRLTKKILQGGEFKRLNRHDVSIKEYLRGITVPQERGVYRVSPGHALAIAEQLDTLAGEREMLVDDIVAAYRATVEAARKALNKQFSADDYPDVDTFRSCYSMSWQFFTMGLSEDLETLTKQFISDEKQKMAQMFERVREQGVEMIREEFKDLVDTMIVKLTPDADGKPKRFYASKVSQLVAFLANFEARNMGDPALAKLVEQAKGMLNGVNPEAVGGSDVLKEALAQGMNVIKGQLDFLVTKGGRSVRADDIDAEGSA